MIQVIEFKFIIAKFFPLNSFFLILNRYVEQWFWCIQTSILFIHVCIKTCRILK